MIGTSSKAAVFSGIRTNLLLVKTYMISGICAALGGMVMLANYNSARADYGTVYTLQCVLIVVLGGVNPNGGSGKVSGQLLHLSDLGRRTYPRHGTQLLHRTQHPSHQVQALVKRGRTGRRARAFRPALFFWRRSEYNEIRGEGACDAL